MRPLLASWDALPARQRVLAAIGALIVALGLALFFAAGPLTAAVARAQADVARARLVQQVAHERLMENEGLARASAPSAVRDVRTAAMSVLTRFALHATPADSATQDGRVGIVVSQVQFDTLVAALDALAREDGVHLIEATVTARVEPGAVRAELTLGR
jgi:type II secretory pathway component PulM